MGPRRADVAMPTTWWHSSPVDSQRHLLSGSTDAPLEAILRAHQLGSGTFVGVSRPRGIHLRQAAAGDDGRHELTRGDGVTFNFCRMLHLLFDVAIRVRLVGQKTCR